MSCELENIIAPRELCDEAQMAQDAWKFYEARGLRPLYSRVKLRTISRDDIPEHLREHLAQAEAFVMGQVITFIEPDWSEFKQKHPFGKVAQVVAHETAHVFIGTKYEPWVYESMAEAAASVYALYRYGKCYMTYESLWLHNGLYKVNPTFYASEYTRNYHFASAFFNYLVEHDNWSIDPYDMYMSSLLSLIEGVYRCTEPYGMRKVSVIDTPGFFFDYYVDRDRPAVARYLRSNVAHFVASRYGAVEVSRGECVARSVYLGGGVTASVIACKSGVTYAEIRATGKMPQRKVKPAIYTISAEEVGVSCDHVGKRLGRGSVVKAYGYTTYYPVPPDVLVSVAKVMGMGGEMTAEGACLWDIDFPRLSTAVAWLYADKTMPLHKLKYAVNALDMHGGNIALLLGRMYLDEVNRCIRQRKPLSACDSVALHIGNMADRIFTYVVGVSPELNEFFLML